MVAARGPRGLPRRPPVRPAPAQDRRPARNPLPADQEAGGAGRPRAPAVPGAPPAVRVPPDRGGHGPLPGHHRASPVGRPPRRAARGGPAGVRAHLRQHGSGAARLPGLRRAAGAGQHALGRARHDAVGTHGPKMGTHADGGAAPSYRHRYRTRDSRKEETMTSTARPTAPDLEAIKQRQQATWASGDFHAVGARIVITAEELVDAADLRAGWRVLDVATGSANAAIAAARLGCHAVGVDYVPALLERGRVRAAAEGLDVELLEGDAEALPFPDDSFDAVTSVFGTMFAPDHERTAAELVRVTRPGGTIALASWRPAGFIGELFRTITAYLPPPAGLRSPMLWGTAD